MSPEIAILRGQLTLTIGDTPAVNLGYIDIPISATTERNSRGELVLKVTPNMREVRELIGQVFIADHDRIRAFRNAQDLVPGGTAVSPRNDSGAPTHFTQLRYQPEYQRSLAASAYCEVSNHNDRDRQAKRSD